MTIAPSFKKSSHRFGDMASEFFRLESAGGIILVVAAALALIVANSPLYGLYHYILNDIQFRIGFSDVTGHDAQVEKSILLWINDGLMAIFFFLVGLEIKREFIKGELSSRERALLPALCAVGGMAIPAAIYWFLNQDNPEAVRGWAIPAATDIAFALGVLSLLGTRVPTSLKALLLGIAVIDDLGAIIIIAVFFSGHLAMTALYGAGICVAIMAALNIKGVASRIPYILLTMILWVCVLKSGVHATIAGVLGALFIPLSCPKDPNRSPAEEIEHSLHPWVAFGVLPLFGFANAGVPFDGMGWHSLMDPITLGIAAGLFIGKQIGIFLVMVFCVVTRISPMPSGANWMQLYGVSLLCGIGFTMSLFIGGLALEGIHMQASVRLGVLVGSIASALLGYLVLHLGSSSSVQRK